MKKMTSCIVLVLVFASCKKNDPPAPSSTSNGTVYVPAASYIGGTVDGTAFPVESTECDYITPGYTSISSFYNGPAGTDYKEIELFVADTLSVGTYVVPNFQGADMYIAYYDTIGGYYSDSGTLNVTLNDTVHKVMKGYFSAALINITPVTHHVQGTFVINYQ